MVPAFIGGLGMGELLVILAIVMLVFGAGKLPQIGDALGRTIKNFKKAATTPDNEIDVSPPAQAGQLPPATPRDASARPGEEARKA